MNEQFNSNQASSQEMAQALVNNMVEMNRASSQEAAPSSMNNSIEYIEKGMFQYFIRFDVPQKKYKPLKSDYNFIIFRKTIKNINTERTINETKSIKFVDIPTVHEMHTWKFAYKQARMSNWQVDASNRAHFSKRVKRIEKIVGPVLEEKHDIFQASCKRKKPKKDRKLASLHNFLKRLKLK